MSAELRIAVTGVSGEVGLGVLDGLATLEKAPFVLALDYSDDCAGYHRATAQLRMPPVAAPGYVELLIAALSRHRIQMLIPGIDSEIELLANHRQRIESETGCFVLVADAAVAARCADKLLTGTFCEAHGLPYLPTWIGQHSLPDGAVYPLIAKPRRGNAARGVTVLRSAEEHRAWGSAGDVSKYCLQPLIEGDEYTVGLTFDREEMLRDWLAMRRTLADGRTVVAEVCELPVLDELLEAAAKSLRVRGALNLQLRVDAAGEPWIFEVNPRLSGSTQLRVAVGYNDPLRLVRHHLLGAEMAKAKVQRARVYRYFTQMVVPHA